MHNSFLTSLEELHISRSGICGSGFSLVSHLALHLAPAGYLVLSNFQPSRIMKGAQMPNEMPVLRIKSCLSVTVIHAFPGYLPWSLEG